MSDIALIYIGKGTFKVNVPARDLSAEELKTLPLSREELIESGLYKEPEPVKKKELSQKDKE